MIAMKRIGLSLILCLVVLAGAVAAQGTPTLSSLEIALWPEYDRPEMLVIYQGTFAADTPLPMPVEIWLPARVGQPTAVAYVDETGQRLNQTYSTRVEGEMLVVSFELPTLAFQLEYYDTLPIDAAGQREYTLIYTADYAVEDVSLELQVPPTAQDVSMEPLATPIGPQGDGLAYYQADGGSMEQGQSQSWTIRYQKDNADLTAASLASSGTSGSQAAPTSQGALTVQGGDNNSTVLLFVVAFGALLAVGVGAFWLGQHTQPVAEEVLPPPRRQKHRGSGRSTRSPDPPASALNSEVAFCYKCGAKLRPDSEFCHKCGAVVR
jgi:ribosomal protein L40E